MNNLSDRELDARIAEKVMGVPWKRFAPHMVRAGSTYGRMLYCIDDDFNREHLELASLDDPLYQPKIDKATGQEWLSTVPRYSTEISAAMAVLDKADGMWQLTRAVEREVLDDDSTPYVLRYHCQMRIGDNLGYGYAVTKERAICEAALKAVESDAR